MATLYGSNATRRLVNNPPDKVDAGVQHGRVRVSYDTYTAAGALSNGDVIRMGYLPKGARVVGYWLKSNDLGTTGTCKVGYEASADAAEAADDDAFFASVDLNAAAITLDQGDQENMPGLGKEFSGECQISITLTAATTAAGTISFCCMYTVD